MKKSCLVLVTSIFISFNAFADSLLSFQTEIVPQVVNSMAVDSGIFTNVDQIKIIEGSNQIGVTIGQIVFEDSKRRKFDSSLMLITFKAADEDSYQLSYKKMRTIEEANKFDKSPTFTLTDGSGEPVDFDLVVLPKSGFQGFNDYEKQVVSYNKLVDSGTALTVAPVSADSMTSAIKSQFSKLSREKQQQFMQWAMQNLK
ncbi:DUF2057 domain-containing protein [Vibrio sp. B1Z05]|uniref:YccT family protein n=1 Tax=Vibrio sp. B1Z05 TaxID=2654980 RepID=UPI00128D01EC|nr:DUF2057 domain-containing protein [Vibrio sp. B1Z05]MPW37114.1 DUF2057 domain-containing protein [Vibrio sp. B1Z05]